MSLWKESVISSTQGKRAANCYQWVPCYKVIDSKLVGKNYCSNMK